MRFWALKPYYLAMEMASRTSKMRVALVDYGIPLMLLVPVYIMLWVTPGLVSAEQARLPMGADVPDVVIATPLTYIWVTAVFLALVVRRRYPLVVLAVTTVLAGLFVLVPNPPAPVQLAPLVALYSVGVQRDRRTVLMAYAAVTGFTMLMVLRPFEGLSWIADAVSILTSFGVAGALGDATRSRRAYIAAVELRAADAERTREDEARRRVEEERLRIARELHDVTAHSLSIIALQAGAAEKAVHRDPESAISALGTIRVMSKNSLDELRAMLGVLRGADEDAPLSPAGRLERLPELVATVEQSGVQVTLDMPEDLGEIPAYADLSAYRIVQEAMTNVVRHAHATHVSVVVRQEPQELVIEVADDGRGTTAQAVAEGHGIAGMRERVAALGGTFEAGVSAGGGFRVAARLPLARGVQRRDA